MKDLPLKMSPLPPRGLFLSFEGGDGAGKTTLIEGFFSALLKEGFSLLKTRAPGGTPIGKEIRSLLLEKHPLPRTELLLFLADRAEHVDAVIKPALLEKKIVLCDRFHDSTIAYQAGARGFELERVEELCLFASNSLVPDLTFYLDLDPEVGLSRIQKGRGKEDRIEKETLSFHQKIRSMFQYLAKKHPQRIHTLDASLSPETLLKEALNAFFTSYRT